jgi:hypothetical protein
VVRGPVIALLALLLLVWVGMGVSTATLLRRAEVPSSRAWPLALVAWPLVLWRVRGLRE